MRGDVYKEYYPIDIKLKASITKHEKEIEIEKYYEKLAICIETFVCSECGQPVVIDDTWLRDEIRERTISGMCRMCQHKLFGAI